MGNVPLLPPFAPERLLVALLIGVLAGLDRERAFALEVAVISVIILPLLPDRGYGPWAVLKWPILCSS